MITINLLPGTTKRASSGMPGLGGNPFAKLQLPSFNRSVAVMGGIWIAAAGAVGWMHYSTTSEVNALSIELEAAVRDSTRYATLKAQGDSLAAQEAVIAQKLELIQTIDAQRFIWPHILDEVSAALPPYVWLLSLGNSAAESAQPQIRVMGMAGTTFALTQYMEQLEASPFIQGVRLISSERQHLEERSVHTFALEMRYQEPPADVIQTMPLFGSAEEN
jgi:Tfp pilus assembly protein PilN